jgi:hypothetical protein
LQGKAIISNGNAMHDANTNILLSIKTHRRAE